MEQGSDNGDQEWIRAELKLQNELREELEKQLEDARKQVESSQAQILDMESECASRVLKIEKQLQEAVQSVEVMKEEKLQLVSQQDQQLRKKDELITSLRGELQHLKAEAGLKHIDQLQQKNEKNRKIEEFLKLNKILADKVSEMEKDNSLLTEELDAVDQEWKRAEAELKQQKEVREELEKQLDDTSKQVESLQAQILDMESQSTYRGVKLEKQLHEALQSAEDMKAERLQLVAQQEQQLRKRDDLITSLREELQYLQNEAGLKHIVDQLHQKVSDYESKVKQLQSELDDANKELLVVTEEIVRIDSQARLKAQALVDEKEEEIRELRSQLGQRDGEEQEQAAANARLLTELQDRNEQMMELRTRMHEYERGTYGLQEAVREIKELKGRLSVLDSEMRIIVLRENEALRKVGDLYDENTVLRDRLGMSEEDRVDLGPLRLAQKIEMEQLRGVNARLAKEIEQLEEERIALKSDLRLAALHRGERAVQLGLNSEELEALEAYSDNLRQHHPDGARVPPLYLPKSANLGVQELTAEVERLKEALYRERGRADALQTENEMCLELVNRKGDRHHGRSTDSSDAPSLGFSPSVAMAPRPDADGFVAPVALSSRGERLQSHGASVMGASEVHHKSGSSVGPVVPLSPMSVGSIGDARSRSLRSMQPLDTRSPRMGVHEREELARLKDELEATRHQLEQSRKASDELQSTLAAERLNVQHAASRAAEQEAEIHELKVKVKTLASRVVPDVPLPPDLETGADQAATRATLWVLNAQLLVALEQATTKERELETLTEELVKCRDSLEEMVAQQDVLYRDYADLRSRNERLVNENKTLKEHTGEDGIRSELQKTLEVLDSQGTDKHQDRLVEVTRKLIQLQLQEGAAARKVVLQELHLAEVRQENTGLLEGMADMEKCFEQRVLELREKKDKGNHRLRELQAELDHMVPKEHADRLADELHRVMINYQKSLDDAVLFAGARTEAELLRKEVQELRDQLSAWRLKEGSSRDAADAAERWSLHLDDPAFSPLDDASRHTLAATLAGLSAREKDATRKAEVANMQAVNCRTEQAKLEARVKQLEQLLANAMDETARLKEQELRRGPQVASLPKGAAVDAAEAEKAAQAEAERRAVQYRDEAARLQEVWDMAKRHSDQLAALLSVRDKRLETLSKAFEDKMSDNDSRAKYGELQYQLVASRRACEAVTQREQHLKAEMLQLRAYNRQLQLRDEELSVALFRMRDHWRSQVKFKDSLIDSLTVRLRGWVFPEKLKQVVKSLQVAEHKSMEMLYAAESLRDQVYALKDEVGLKEREVETLTAVVSSLSNSRSVPTEMRAQISEWAKKVQSAKALEGALRRQVSRLEEKVGGLERENHGLEAELLGREAEWAHVEASLEKQLTEEKIRVLDAERRLRLAQDETHAALQQAAARAADLAARDAATSLTDDGEPRTPSEMAKLFVSKLQPSLNEEFVEKLAAQNTLLDTLQRELEESKAEALEKERVLQELLSRGRGTAGGEASPRKEWVSMVVTDVGTAEEVASYMKRTAQATINQLLEELRQQKDLVKRYRDMVQKLHQEPLAGRDAVEVEAANLERRSVAEGENMVSQMRAALKQMERDAVKSEHPVVAAEHVEHLLTERDIRIEVLEQQVAAREQQMDLLQRRAKEQERHIERLMRELEEQKASVHAPSKRMQSEISQLRIQLKEKEKEQGRLNAAIVDLKKELMQDMAGQALLQSHAAASEAGSGEAEAMQKRLVMLAARMTKAKEEVEKQREACARSNQSLDALQEQCNKLQTTVMRQANDIAKLQRAIASAELDKKRLQALVDSNPRVQELERKLRVLQMQAFHQGSSRLPRSVAEDETRGEGAAPPPLPPVNKLPPPVQRLKAVPATKAHHTNPNKAASDTVVPPRVAVHSKQPRDTDAQSPTQEDQADSGNVDAGPDAAGTSAADALPVSVQEEVTDPPAGSTVDERETPRPDSQPAPHLGAQRSAAVLQWHADKKLQRKVQILRAKLEQKSQQAEEAEHHVQRLKELVAQLEKDKGELQGALADTRRDKESQGGLPRGAWDILRKVEEAGPLQDKLVRAEEEITRLQRVVQVEKEAEIKRLSARIRQLEAAGRQHGESGTGAADSLELQQRTVGYERRIKELEEQLLEKDNVNIELRFDTEHARLAVARLQKRLQELMAYNGAISIARQHPSSAMERGPVRAHPTPARAAKDEMRLREMEEVVEAMKRVVDKVQTENEALKRAVPTNVRYMDLLKENKTLHSKIAELEDSLLTRQREAMHEAGPSLVRANRTIANLQRQLKKALEVSEQRRQTVEHLGEERRRLQDELEARKGAASAAPQTGRDFDGEILSAAQQKASRAELENQRLWARLGRLKEQLEHVRADLQEKSDEIGRRDDEIAALHAQLLDAERKQRPQPADPRVPQLVADIEKLKSQNMDLKNELSAFDPQFFEEIEDLKFNYQEQVQINSALQNEIQVLKGRLGLPMTAPISV